MNLQTHVKAKASGTRPIMISIARSRKLICLAAVANALNGATVSSFAHEEGAPFSGAITDPLILHHAHIEDEQRFNFFSAFGVHNGAGRKANAYDGEFELAYSSSDFRYGFEIFVPVSNRPSPNSDRREIGVGDIEFRPLKLALYNAPELVVSTAISVLAPTGNKRLGFGEGQWSGTQFLFADFARGNWYLGANLGLERKLSGPSGMGLEYGVALAYSFIAGTEPGGLAAPQPEQNWVISPSLELAGSHGLQGVAADMNSLSLVPGLTFWHTRSGWQFHVGFATPVSGARDSDATLLIQVGNHFNWGSLF
jgi:hypothetical protein